MIKNSFNLKKEEDKQKNLTNSIINNGKKYGVSSGGKATKNADGTFAMDNGDTSNGLTPTKNEFNYSAPQPTLSPIKIPGKTPVGQGMSEEDSFVKPVTAKKDPLTPDVQAEDSVVKELTPQEKALQRELEKNKKDRDKAIDETYKEDILAKGELNTQKQNYTNFDDVDAKFNNVIKDLSDIQKESGQPLTEQDYQNIADKYELDVNDVKSPKNIYNTLEYSEEGKIATGLNKVKQGEEDRKTAFERNKADIQTRIDQAKEDTSTQIDEVGKQIESSMDFATKQGAWSGGLRSSGYMQGLQNIKDNGTRVIEGLEKGLSRMEGANKQSLERITEDYTKQVSRASEELSSSMNDIKRNTGLELNGLTEKYGLGSEILTNALDEIAQNFHTMNNSAINGYLQNVSNIQALEMNQISELERQDALREQKQNARFAEYTANNGLLLENTSLDGLFDELSQGIITEKNYGDMKNIMLSGISDTLGAGVTTEDLTKIEDLLSSGYTPKEVVAEMRTDERFQPVEEKKYREFGGTLYEETADGLKSVIEGKEDLTFREFNGNLYKETNTGLELVEEGKEEKTPDSWAKLNDDTLYNERTGQHKEINPGKGGYFSSLGNGNITGYGGAYDGFQGLDVDGEVGDPVLSPFSGKIIEAKAHPLYGNTIVIENSETGEKIRYSHLDEMNSQVGQTINANSIIGTLGNTGNVTDINGNKVSPEQLAKGVGSHLDIVSYDANGKARNSKETEQYLKTLGESEKETEQDNVSIFNYADTLTSSDKTKFLQSKGLEDAYITYKGKQGGADADFGNIQDITDINFPEKTTEFKTKSFGFGNRMDTSNDVIKRMEEKYKDSWTLTETLAPRGGYVPNFLKTSERQNFEQAQRNFINAVLRQESGAVIADSEFDNAAKQYFPAAGDSESTIDQKQNNREQVIENMYRSSGKDDKGRNIVDIYKHLKSDGSQSEVTQKAPETQEIDGFSININSLSGAGGLADDEERQLEELYNSK